MDFCAVPVSNPIVTVEDAFREYLTGNEYISADQVDWTQPVELVGDSTGSWYEFTDTRSPRRMRCWVG